LLGSRVIDGRTGKPLDVMKSVKLDINPDPSSVQNAAVTAVLTALLQQDIHVKDLPFAEYPVTGIVTELNAKVRINKWDLEELQKISSKFEKKQGGE
jgi:hypothetical protein